MHPYSPFQRTTWPLLLLLSGVLVVFARGADPNEAWRGRIEQLRRGIQPDAASSLAAELLGDSSLAAADRRDRVVDFIRVVTEQTMDQPAHRRAALWTVVHQAAGGYESQAASDRGRCMVRLQEGLAWLGEAEWSWLDVELAADTQTALVEAREHIRIAVRHFEELDRQLSPSGETRSALDKSARPGAPSGAGPSAIPPVHLLRDEVQYYLARAYTLQAAAYPNRSPDRVDAATRAQRLLARLSGVADDHPLAWKSRVEEVRVYRLLGSADALRRRWNAFIANDPPPQVRSLLQIAAAEWLVDEGHTSEALRMLTAAAPPEDAPAEWQGSWRVARCRALVAAWQGAVRSGDRVARDQYQSQIRQMLEACDQLPRQWAARVEHVTAPLGSSVWTWASLERRADQALGDGDWRRSIELYGEAAERARSAGKQDEAFSLELKMAAIHFQQQKYAAASQLARAIAIESPRHPQSAQAHQLAMLAAAQWAAQQPDAALATYEELLGEHLNTWPRSAYAGQVASWLGRLLEQRHQWQQAITAYQRIEGGDDDFRPAIARIAICYGHAWENAMFHAPDQARVIAEQAIEFFQRTERTVQSVDALAAADAALEGARFRLLYLPRSAAVPQAGSAAWESVRNRQGESDHPVPNRILALRVIARAAAGDLGEARDVVQRMGASSCDALLDVVVGLSQLLQEEDVAHRGVAELELMAFERLDSIRPEDPGSGDAGLWWRAQQPVFELIRARALTTCGNVPGAQTIYNRLATHYPQYVWLRGELAGTLETSKDPAVWALALAEWRAVLRRTQPAEPLWYRAKYGIACYYARRGDKRRAAELIRLTQALHPTLGGPRLREQFLELLAQCHE